MNISPHFTVEELTHSDKAVKLLLSNVPNEEGLANLKRLCERVLEPFRAYLGKPIDIDSAFRSEEVNQAVGGVPGSQHTKGEAADIKVDGLIPLEVLAKLIESGIEFDEGISELDITQQTAWTHVSYTIRRHNRKLAKRAIRENGTTTYFPYENRASQ